jgi:transposase
VLDVLENRDQSSVQAYLEAGKASGLLAQLEEVTTDMWDGYVAAVKAVFQDTVRITIDRFHVMKNFQDHLTEARRQIQRELAKDEATALKGTRWLWVTNSENLDAKQRAELELLKQRFPRLKVLVEQRETLRQLFEDRTITDAPTGAARLRAWVAKARQLGLKGLDAFCRTLENWLDKIANYFVNRASNGRTEGFNHGLRTILWRAFGMKNLRLLAQRHFHFVLFYAALRRLFGIGGSGPLEMESLASAWFCGCVRLAFAAFLLAAA